MLFRSDSKTEQMEKLQKDFDAKEAELANLQLKAEDSSTDPCYKNKQGEISPSFSFEMMEIKI